MKNRAQRGSWVAALLLATSLACGGGGDGGGVTPPGRIPASVTFEGGSAVAGTVATALPSAVNVIVRAANGQTLAGISVQFSASAGSISASSAQTDPAGRASAGTWTLGNVAGTQTLTATAGPVSGQLVATAAAGPPARLEFSRQLPSTVRAGAPITPVPELRLVDQFGNGAGGAGRQVTATFQTGTGVIGGGTAATDVTGLAAFTALTIGGAVGPRVIAFTTAGLPPIVSAVVTVDPGLAATIQLQNAPVTARAGVAFDHPVVATVTDRFNNVLSRPATEVTATLAEGGGNVAGGTAATDTAGRAVFTALAIEGTVGSKRLRFAAEQATVTTDRISLTPGPAARLVVLAQPSRAENAALFPSPVLVQVTDRFANGVADSRTVTATIAAGGGALASGAANTDASGVATFSALRIVGLVGTRTLSFSSTGLTAATSAPIVLDPGPVRSLALLQAPSASITVATPFAQQPSLQIADTSGNLVRRAGIVVRANLLGVQGELLNDAAFTDVNGVATFQQLTFLPALPIPSSIRVRFSSSTVAIATSGPLSVDPGTASPVRSVQYGGFAQRLFILDPGGTLALSGVVRDAGGAVLPNVPIVYTSANASVASVRPTGTIVGAGAGTAWVRAFGAGAPTIRDSVYVTVVRDATGPVVSTTMLKPIVVAPGISHDFDVVLDTRSTTVGAATILVGMPQELVLNTGISWQGAAGTQIGFDTGFNTLRISFVSANGVTGSVPLARIRITTGQPDFFVNREIVITPIEMVGVNLQDLASRSTGVNIPLIP
ncbi:MAG: hypothetical protein ACT4P7_13960 [Gemmatimonadaceae bacterium]